MGTFNSYGGGIHHSAIIGQNPEHRAWRPGDPVHPPEIDSTARIEALVTIDAGMVRPTKIGARSWLLKNGTHVGHDAIIGDDCEIACGAKIGGHCEIGDGVKIGLNATLLPFVRVGNGARIGAGSVVIRDVPAGQVWAGVPAKCIQYSGTPQQVPYEHIVGIADR